MSDSDEFNLCLSDEELSINSIAEYCSSESETEEKEEIKTKTKKSNKKWVQFATFVDANAVNTWLSVETTWSYFYTNTTKIGTQVYYRCNIAKRRGAQCPSRIYFLYSCSSNYVLMFMSIDSHVHINIATNGINDEKLKRRIDELYVLGIIKPKKMIEMLEDEQFKVPTKVKISNYMRSLRNKKFGATLHLGKFLTIPLPFITQCVIISHLIR